MMSDGVSFFERESTRRALRWGSRLLTLGIITYLVYRLSELGWRQLWDALPTNPLFYVLFVVTYLTLPVAELFIYRQVWPIRAREGLRTFLTKRVFNEEMTGYSGEVYLYWWLRQRTDISGEEAFRVVRDNNILSSFASMSVAFGLVAVLSLTGQLQLGAIIGPIDTVNAVLVAIAVAIVAAVAFRFRRQLFSLPRPVALRILGIHYARMVGANTLLALQWAVGAPGIPVSVWLTYVCIFIVLNRIPFLPSKDLFFLGASVELSTAMGVATTAIAGMLVTASVLVRSTNAIVFITSQFVGRKPPPKDRVATDGDSVTELPQ